MKAFVRVALIAACLLTPESLFAQGSAKDYECSRTYGRRTSGGVYRTRVNPRWLPGGKQFWYRIEVARNKHEFVFVDAVAGKRQPAFDHNKLARQLSALAKRSIQHNSLPFRSITYSSDRSIIHLRAFGKDWSWHRQKEKLTAGKAKSKIAVRESRNKGVEDIESIRRSVDTGGQSYLSVKNETKQNVTLIWINRSGQPRSYGTIAPGKTKRQRTYAGHVWLVRDAAGKPISAFISSDQPGRVFVDGKNRPKGNWDSRRRRRRAVVPRSFSPDGKWAAFFRDHNLVLRDRKTNKERQLSKSGKESDYFSGPIHWSPDSKKIVVTKRKRGQGRQVYLIESSPRSQLQPKLHQMTYAKPGDQLNQNRPQLFHIDKGQISLKETLFSNPWSTREFRWAKDSSRFTFAYNQRGHQVLRIIAVDANTGASKAIVDERSKTFIDYAYKRYANYLDASNEIIWMSERDGWNHLYMYDSKTGKVKQQITKGKWVVRSVERVDVAKKQIWFRAAGIYPKQDPYYIHLCRVNFDGTGFVKLTAGDGTHRWRFSPTGEYLVDTYSRVDQPPVTELRRVSDGQLMCKLESSDWSQLLATGWRPPERFVAKARDGKTDIYGIIVRPTNFDARKKYAVIEKIYAGPHGSFVPKSFSRLGDHYSMAELGFIVVQIDGMGTSNRSKAFHNVCYKNLGDSGFPDRILWMKAAQKKYPQLDLSRVGIYGGSAGGQSALRALLAFGDNYHAAVADCGCHDNRMDKVWWNELWMGWPIGPHYKEQSNVTQAHRLKGKLLLMVGEMDRNVDPASTMQVVNALIKADKDFDLVVFPGGGHGAGGSRYGRRRRMDFFVRHLLKKEPRWKAD